MNEQTAKRKLLAMARRMASVACAGGCLMEIMRFPQLFKDFDYPAFERKCLDLKVTDADIAILKSDIFLKDLFKTFAQQQQDNTFSEATLRSVLWDALLSHIFTIEEDDDAPSFNFISELDVREVFTNVDFRLIDLSVVSKKFNVPLLIVEVASTRVEPSSYHKDFTKLATLMCFSCEELAKKMNFLGMDFKNISIQGILIGHSQFEFFIANPLLEEVVEIVEPEKVTGGTNKRTKIVKKFQFSVSVTSCPHWRNDLFSESPACSKACCTSNHIKRIPAKKLKLKSLNTWSNSSDFFSKQPLNSFWEEFDPCKVDDRIEEINPFTSEIDETDYNAVNWTSLGRLVKFCGNTKRLASELDLKSKTCPEKDFDEYQDHVSNTIIWPEVKRRAIPQARDDHETDTVNKNKIRDFFLSSLAGGYFVNSPPSLDQLEMNRMQSGSKLRATDTHGNQRIVSCVNLDDFMNIYHTHKMLLGCPMFETIHGAYVSESGFYIIETEVLEILAGRSLFEADFINKFDFCTVILEAIVCSIEVFGAVWWMHNVAGIAHMSISPSSLCYGPQSGIWKLAELKKIRKLKQEHDPKSSSDVRDLARAIWRVFGEELEAKLMSCENKKDVFLGREILSEFREILFETMVSSGGRAARPESVLVQILQLYLKYCDHGNLNWRQEAEVLTFIEKILRASSLDHAPEVEPKATGSKSDIFICEQKQVHEREQTREEDTVPIIEEQEQLGDENQFDKNIENSFSSAASEKLSLSSGTIATSEEEDFNLYF